MHRIGELGNVDHSILPALFPDSDYVQALSDIHHRLPTRSAQAQPVPYQADTPAARRTSSGKSFRSLRHVPRKTRSLTTTSYISFYIKHKRFYTRYYIPFAIKRFWRSAHVVSFVCVPRTPGRNSSGPIRKLITPYLLRGLTSGLSPENGQKN